MMKSGKLVAISAFTVLLACTAELGEPVEALGLSDVLPWFKLDFKSMSHLADSSNDEAVHLSTQRLIERAGFNYENYYALADDGYITQLIRIINPLADQTDLKRPPIIIQHGQTANSKNFVMQSNKQHHPMRWPPNPEEGAQKPSSNRSLALMLANNGYDVWLSSNRGVDGNNNGYIQIAPALAVRNRKNYAKNMTAGEEDLLLRRTENRGYWSFTLDDQIAHEMPSQVATVLNVTGAPKVTLFGYSNTALTTFAMLSIRPDIAARVDTYIASAPVVYYSKLDGWFKWFMADFMQLIPASIDAQLFLNDQTANFVRKVLIRTCKNLTVRYTFCKFALDLMFGESGQFRTNLELPFFGHLIRPTSWKCLAQHLQIVKRHKVAKFDYGARRNLRFYGTKEPPEYNLSNVNSNIHVALVSGEKDNWANPATVEEIRRKLPMKPSLDLVITDYNHLDLTAAFDVDVRVNLPLLRLLDKRNLELSEDPSWEKPEASGSVRASEESGEVSNEIETGAEGTASEFAADKEGSQADNQEVEAAQEAPAVEAAGEEHQFNPLGGMLKSLNPIKSLNPFSALADRLRGQENQFNFDPAEFLNSTRSRALSRVERYGDNLDLFAGGHPMYPLIAM